MRTELARRARGLVSDQKARIVEIDTNIRRTGEDENAPGNGMHARNSRGQPPRSTGRDRGRICSPPGTTQVSGPRRGCSLDRHSHGPAVQRLIHRLEPNNHGTLESRRRNASAAGRGTAAARADSLDAATRSRRRHFTGQGQRRPNRHQGDQVQPVMRTKAGHVATAGANCPVYHHDCIIQRNANPAISDGRLSSSPSLIVTSSEPKGSDDSTETEQFNRIRSRIA